MTKFEALVGLNLTGSIGSIRLNKLLAFFGTPENILKASPQKLMQVSGIAEATAAKLSSVKKEDIDKELALAKKLGLKILTQEDKEYPENLKNIYDPAIILYVKGKLEECDKYSIGVVGSRRASFYGLSNAEKFSYDLSLKGFTIVSGMARGVDTYSHRGALSAKGRTIAVIGSGFNRMYPFENKKLAERIAETGAVISEFPINTEPFKHNFPQRNRTISGLSLGVLVVEAAQNSGALITADFALEQGRDVFALPGNVNSPNSFGTNELIKQGAKPVTCVEDILEEFSPLQSMGVTGFTSVSVKTPQEKPVKVSPEKLSNTEESLVYGLISKEAVELDELVERTDFDIPRISAILLKLQLSKLIQQLPGKQFVRP